MKVAINGLGRIGRPVLKLCLEKGIDVVAINDLWTDFTQRRNNRNRGRVTVRRTEDPVVEQIQPEVPVVEPAANPALAINNNTVLDQLLIELEQAVNNINNG